MDDRVTRPDSKRNTLRIQAIPAIQSTDFFKSPHRSLSDAGCLLRRLTWLVAVGPCFS
jgi:hypothetical protein